MFADYSFKNKKKIFFSIFYVYITTLKYIPKASWTVYNYVTFLSIIYYTCVVYLIRYLKNFDLDTLYPVFVGQ